MTPYDQKGFKTKISRMVTSHPVCICADGFSMSVQASEYNYCTPRESDADRYVEVEVGFPSSEEPLLVEYADDKTDLTNTVYGYVPVGIVTTVIAKHGGLVEGEVPPGVAPLKASAR